MQPWVAIDGYPSINARTAHGLSARDFITVDAKRAPCSAMLRRVHLFHGDLRRQRAQMCRTREQGGVHRVRSLLVLSACGMCAKVAVQYLFDLQNELFMHADS